MATVMIDGAAIDQDDPCALPQALYAVKLKMLAGGHVEEVEIQSPATRRRLKVSAGNLAAIDAELMKLAAACDAKQGRRSRFAKSMRFV